jgi:hypothetical protein
MQDMLEHTSDPAARQKQRILLQQKHKEELKHTDMKLVLQLDQKVRTFFKMKYSILPYKPEVF